MHKKLTAFIFLLSVMQVRADWQQTHWGEGLDTVLTGKAEGMRRLTPVESSGRSIEIFGTALATSTYRTAEFSTVANYMFRENKLSAVQLKFANEEDGLRALERLRSQYGKPMSAVDTMSRDCRDIREQWRDEPRGNMVRFDAYLCIGSIRSISISYTPLVGARDTGL